MDVNDIYQALFNYFSNGYCYQMQNVYVFHWEWESDFFCMNKEGYSFEMEVKVSRSDFKADFKKPKHDLFRNQIDDLPIFTTQKHPKRIPNRFYYAVPKGLISVDEVPSYAGLIYVDKRHAYIVKRAPFIHRTKIDFRRKLCDKFYYQWLALKKENKILKRDKSVLQKQLSICTASTETVGQ